MEVSIFPRWRLKCRSNAQGGTRCEPELECKGGQQWALVARWSSLRSISLNGLIFSPLFLVFSFSFPQPSVIMPECRFNKSNAASYRLPSL